MTNVKLKLMFFLLNSLLTADIIHARPYSDRNSTDIIIKFSNNNNTFNIPVDSNSDTLIVANDDETPEETNKSSNNQMEAIVNAEQDRDEAMSEKVMKDQISIADAEKKDAGGVEKQLNISGSTLEQIMNSETDRDETLTDILFRSESEFADDMPKFEFLIATRINESDTNRTVKDSGFSDNSLDRVRNSSDVLKKVDYVELVEVLKPKISENKSAYSMNITGHEVDNDLAPDTSFTDVQTLFLACFGTLLPLLAVLFATLLIRCMCRRWCPGCCKKSTSSSVSESSEKQEANQQLKSPTEESAGDAIENGEAPPANGSIFTMTLKNNHLIVETEERNDITKNGRETKMKYSPDNDGIFVVEVQQSTAYRPNNNKSLQNSPPHDPQISTNQALIHRVPEELDKKIDEERSSGKFERERTLALSSTGLSISDLSMSSIGSHNVSYSYGSQVGYEQGPFGYPLYAGYDISKDEVEGIVYDNSQEPLISKTPTDPDKPVVTAAIFKQDSIIGNDALQGPGYCIEGSSDGPLLSDVQAREYSLQHLYDQREKKIENGVAVPISDKNDSPKKAVSRADSLPVRLEEDKVPDNVIVIDQNSVMETIKEDDVPKEAFKGKRASLPIIRTDMYESVKDAILPSGSPKFEKLMNDASPSDNIFEPPPMITITEENESGKSEVAS
ncbi:uncharacterized protein LOC113520843 isoform X2 [Galleria mellonella]|uniref:Uncharacterized protein LOC113520843 isoform X2 n=1 Tax=Galleria mellonella TaxID=7137 RepID=A0ABM3MQ33_GALME|nr:uncharacterized protein LOC113520843 isoform X2 [Galleria mellonella]